MAGPAKIEFLTGSRSQTGLEIHEVPSSRAHWLFRPQRLPQPSWEVTAQPPSLDGSRLFVLRNSHRDRYVLLTAQEYFLWERFDGSLTLGEIARLFHHSFGAFDYSIISRLLEKLSSAGLLEKAGELRVQRGRTSQYPRRWARIWWRLLIFSRRLSFSLRDADRYCTAIYNWGGFILFNRFVLIASLIITACAVAVVIRLFPQAKQIALGLAGKPFLSSATMIVTLLAAAILHVSVHALACKAYGRKVREVGFFLLQGVLPTFYADVTDIFMANRRARIVVDLAGPMVEVVLGSVAFLAAYASAPGVGQSLLFGAGILLWEGALLNLYPFNFLEMDGYNILADLLAMPALRQQALKLMPTLVHRFVYGPKFEKPEWIQLGYLTVCFISSVVFIILHLDAVVLH